MMNLRRVAMVLPVATLLFFASAGSVLAECSPQEGDFPPPRYAFTATVTDLTRDVTQNLPGMAEFDWHFDLDVDRTYRGEVPDRLGASGWDAGCGFTGIRVREGDRLFIAVTRMDPGDPRLVPDEILLWRDIGGGRWVSDAEALGDGGLSYPRAALRADTTREILDVLRGLRAPDTSTAPSTTDARDVVPLPMVLTGLFAVTFAVLVRPRSRIRRDAPPNG